MTRTFDRISTSVARHVAAFIARHTGVLKREWAHAMARELDDIDGGWSKLRWSLGGLSLMWTFRSAPDPSRHESWFSAFVFNVLVLIVCYLAVFVLTETFQAGGSRGWMRVLPVACAIACVLALSVRARAAASIAAAFAVFNIVRLSGFWIFERFETRAIVGWPALADNVADAAAAALCIFLAASIHRRAMVARKAFGAYVIVTVAVFAVVEVASRAIGGANVLAHEQFGFDHSVFSNYAVALCAALGTVTGAVIGKFGDRIAVQQLLRGRMAR